MTFILHLCMHTPLAFRTYTTYCFATQGKTRIYIFFTHYLFSLIFDRWI